MRAPPAAPLPAPPSVRAPDALVLLPLAVKVVLRGPRGTGKTALLRRLQGLRFVAEHEPTPEIQTATIRWAFKNSDDKIDVEVWDVVDRVLADEQDINRADDDDAPAGAWVARTRRTCVCAAPNLRPCFPCPPLIPASPPQPLPPAQA